MIHTLAIIGLGQIGSSLGKAIRMRKLARTVIGVARRPAVRRRAKAMGVVHSASADPGVIRAADVVVLATPVGHILRSLPNVSRELREDALLTDVGSTKGEILKRVGELQKKRPFHFVGGHPMTGNERAGLDGCDPGMFEKRAYVLIPSRHSRSTDVRTLTMLVRGLGARLHWMKSAADHDRQVAELSHLPHLIACALMGSAAKTSLAGNSFRDATRVSASSPDMVLDFLLTNPGELSAATRRFQKTLRDLAAAAKDGDRAGLRKALLQARKRRSRLV